jgi:hypothetical protein
MGIDIYLEWPNKENDESVEQGSPIFSTDAGHVGYLREAYHGGPYATKLLVREAFEADNCRAEISAAIMRERLTSITEPVYGADGGHDVAAMFLSMLRGTGAQVVGGPASGPLPSGATEPMSVEDAVRTRYKNIYPDCPPDQVEDAVQAFRDFVELAERKEKEHGKPCTVYASY